MPGSNGLANQMCCTRDYHNASHDDDTDKDGTLSMGMWLRCGTDGVPVPPNQALTRFVLSEWGVSLLLSDGEECCKD